MVLLIRMMPEQPVEAVLMEDFAQDDTMEVSENSYGRNH
jgi:hypothetical protein